MTYAPSDGLLSEITSAPQHGESRAGPASFTGHTVRFLTHRSNLVTAYGVTAASNQPNKEAASWRTRESTGVRRPRVPPQPGGPLRPLSVNSGQQRALGQGV